MRPFAPAAALAVALTLAAAAALPAQGTWSVDPTPLLDVAGGAADGSVAFERAVGATRLSDGTIVLVDGLANTVRYLDATGKQFRAVGRTGSGPGEFGGLWWAAQCGADSVFVLDLRRGRVSVLTAGGTIVRDFTVPSFEKRGRPTGFACSRTGTFAYAGLPHDMTPTVPPVTRGAGPLVLGDAAGAITRAMPDVMSSELVVLGGGGMEHPLGRRTTFALGGDRLYVGTADSAAVDVYALDGRKVGTIALRTTPRAPTAAQYARAIEIATQPVPGGARDRVQQMLRQQLPMPAALPPYSAVHTDVAGTLWVTLSAPGDPTTHLRALAPDGRMLGEVHVPVALRLFEIGTDYVLGEHEDEGGETHLVMYRLRKGR